MKPFTTNPKANKDAIVLGKNYRFTILTDALFRYEWAEDGQFEDRASTFAINRDLPVPKFRVLDNGEDSLEIITSRFHLSYDKKKFSPSGMLVDVLGKLTLWGAQWRYGDFGHTMGGTARTLDEADGRIPVGGGVVSRRGYACIDDSASMMFDANGWVGSRRPGDRVDGYLFCYGHDYKDAVKAFFKISGSQALVPRWALGNWWSRYHPYSADEYIGLMDKFGEKQVPLSVAVLDMDWHWVHDKRVTHAGWTGYSFDRNLFPDPAAFGHEMHKRKLKITVNDHPHNGVHVFEDSYQEMAKALDHDTSHGNPIHFDPTNQKFFKAFFEILHRNVEKDACDFWWIDWQQGEHSRIPGIDPLWMLNHFQFLDTGRDGRKGIIFSRFAGPGSQRYPIGFSGDTVISWASLEFQPEFTATASNIGYGWWSHDIGGHFFGNRDDELNTRWVQYGVFSPIFRLHSSNSMWTSREPWLFRKETERIMTNFMRLRHRLIPYLYSMNVRSASQDEPLVQPLYWHYPECEEAYKYPNQYFFGSELLVAPIVKPRSPTTNLASVKAWFPPGHRYVDLFTGIVYDGNRTLSLYRSLDEYPVFAAEGSIIPLDAALEPENGGLNPEGFEVLVVVGQNAQCSVLEDPDDDSPEAQSTAPVSGERGALVQYYQDEGKLSAKVTGRAWTFRFVALCDVKLDDVKVTVNGETSKDAEVEIQRCPQLPSLVIRIPALEGKSDIEVHVGKNPQLSIFDVKARLFRLMLDFQIAFSVKDQIWNVIDAEFVPFGAAKGGPQHHTPFTVNVGQLLALGLDEAVIGPVCELLLADSRDT